MLGLVLLILFRVPFKLHPVPAYSPYRPMDATAISTTESQHCQDTRPPPDEMFVRLTAQTSAANRANKLRQIEAT